MSVRPALRLGPVLLGLAVIVAACSGVAGARPAANGSGYSAGSGNDAPGAPASAAGLDPAQPTFDLGALLSPDPTPDTTPAASPAPSSGPQATPKPVTTAPPAVSTTQATTLLSQVDHLLNEIDGELSNADAAANNPGE